MLSLEDLQLYAEGFPHEHFDRVRNISPVYWNAGQNPFFAVVGYDAAVSVLKDPHTYSSQLGGISIDDPTPEMQPILGSMLPALDPPEHMQLRQQLFPPLKSGSVASLRADIEQRCTSLLVAACAGGELDFIEQVAAEVPVFAFGALMGLARDELLPLRALSDDVIVNGPNNSPGAIDRFFEYFDELVVSRRTNPRDDYMTLLANVENAHGPMTRAERNGMLLQIVIGGLETTRTSIAGTLVELDRHREQWQCLRTRPELLENAVEESLRYVSPVNYVRRTARVDTVLGDISIPAGTRIVVWLGAANRDPSRFASPHTFDIERSNARQHLALSAGEHFCMGAALARLQLVAFWRSFVQEVDDFRLIAMERVPSVQQNALRTLQVALNGAK
jgi:cytochrome P450